MSASGEKAAFDRLTLQPFTEASGEMTLPGSKSISNRVLLLAALAQGTTRIQGLLDSDDTQVMLKALESLGLALQRESATEVSVTGQPVFKNRQADLFLGNAGT